ncbi:DNA polymerase [Achromobacter phage 2-1]|nr:DNA polymerase [Achromobacter phage 2-1]
MLEMQNKILVDARNIDQYLPIIMDEVANADMIGFDIETHDADRHDGLNRFMKADDEGRKSRQRGWCST